MIRASLGPNDHPDAVLQLAALPLLHGAAQSGFRLPPLRFDAGLSDLTSYVAAARPVIAEVLARHSVASDRLCQRLAALENACSARHRGLSALPWPRIADAVPDISMPCGLLLADLRRLPPDIIAELWRDTPAA